MDADPRQGRDVLDRAVSLARRVGSRSLANWAAITRLYAVYQIAEGWEEALAEAESDLADGRAHAALSPLDEMRSLSVQALLRVARGESTDATLAAMEALSAQTTDAFGAAAVHVLRGDRALLAGSFDEARREFLLASEEPNIGEIFLSRAERAALWGHDLASAREIAARLEAHPSSANAIMANRVAARAGIAALEGRLDEAIEGFRDALARHRAIGQDFELATVGLDFVDARGRRSSRDARGRGRGPRDLRARRGTSIPRAARGGGQRERAGECAGGHHGTRPGGARLSRAGRAPAESCVGLPFA